MSLDLLGEIDWSSLREQYRAAKPVPWFKIDNFLNPAFADECARSFPSYEEAQRKGVTFTNVNEKGKFQITKSEDFPEPLRRLEQLLNGRDFLNLIEKVTGIPSLLADDKLVGGGLHSTGPSGHLDVHLDFNVIPESNLHRRLNILVYLNPGWKDEWGGNFELWDEKVKVREQSFLPIFNRCLMFETNEISFHGVSAVQCPIGQVRRSFAAYYYTREAPAHYPGYAHSTIFKARPDEKLKSFLMPLEANAKIVRHIGQRALNKIGRTLKGK